MKPYLLPLLAVCVCVLLSPPTQAGNQKEERLAASVRAALHAAVSDAPPTIAIKDIVERDRWLAEMSSRLERRVPDPNARKELLTTIHYEATRAGLDPQLVLGLIQVESRFRKYALSKAGARGYMQVMPFWVETIGNREDNLFHMRTNLRYGCTILRHYLDLEKGSIYLALGRYNGSRGRPEYPGRVYAAWQKQWAWTPLQMPAKVAGEPTPPTPTTPAPASQPSPVALPSIAAVPDKPAPTPPPTAPPTPVPASKPPALPQQTAAAPPAPAPAPSRVQTPPIPAQTAPRIPARRDIVIVR